MTPGSGPVGSRTAQMTPSPEREPGERASAERGVCGVDEAADVVPGGALARLGAVADEEQELVGVMPCSFDGEPGVAADGGAERDEQLREDGDGVGFGVRCDRVDDPAGEAVEGGLLGRCRKSVGDRQQAVVVGLSAGRGG